MIIYYISNYLSKNELNDYLLKVQKEADDLYDRLVEEYKVKWNVTEELKQNESNEVGLK